MFEKYISNQQVASKTLINAINNNKLSHAYIFEINNYKDYYEYIFQFIKYILCTESRNPDHDENNCKICSSINDNNYIEIKIVNTQSQQIKKEEMLSLQEEFKNKPIVGTKKIYVIPNAEKLNSSSANTILKFLEEPEDNIIAILITPSRYMLMNTIISRCQIIAFNENSEKCLNINDKIYNDNYISEELTDELKNKILNAIEKTISFVDYFEKNKVDTILFTNTYFNDTFKDRTDVLVSFQIMKLLYYDALKNITNKKINYFYEYVDIINLVSEKNTIEQIVRKLEIINSFIERIKYNVNIPLALDKFIMEMGGI